jgi:uncharacterized protein YggU (UPF0235/DUF167 family)
MRVTVRVHPRAARPHREWDGDRLELWIHQPPVDGAANAAVVAEVARWLGVPRHRVLMVSGATSRIKVVEIDDVVTLPPPDVRP